MEKINSLLFRGEPGAFTGDDIAEIEQLICCPIPPRVINLLSRLNGCGFAFVNRIAGGSRENLAGTYFDEGFDCSKVVRITGDNSIPIVIKNIDANFGDYYFPVISDLGGSYVALKLDEPDLPVFYWDHETGEFLQAFHSLIQFFESLLPAPYIPADEIEEDRLECFSVDIQLLLTSN